MFHYTRPSFNTLLPGTATDGLFAGSQRHVLVQDDIRVQAGGKERTDYLAQPKLKPNQLLTTRAPTNTKKKSKKRARRKK